MKRKLTLVTFGQSLYLTFKFFFKNKLSTHAANCSLAFLFSFMPILLLIVVVLVKIFHTTPESLFSLINLQSIFVEPIKITSIVDELLAVENSGVITIITIIYVIWMAQRLFYSVVFGVNSIFHTSTIKPIEKKRGTVVERLFIILGEIILVISIAIILMITKSLKSVIDSEVFFTKIIEPYFPQFIKVLVSNLFSFLLYMLPFLFMFILVTITYKLASGSKPAWKHCILSATECTLCFWVVTIFFKLFLNITRYNLIYGLLSNLVITLLEIYIFFILFFLFAQQIFTHQFFNELLLSELYLLPSEEFNDFKSKIKRALFIRPDKLISNENMHISLKKDDNIYSKDEVSDGVYYVANGKIKLTKDNFTQFVTKGNFFGDFDCIFENERTMSAFAEENSVVIFISKDEFNRLISSNPEVSQKMIESLPSYFFRFYGRNENPLL